MSTAVATAQGPFEGRVKITFVDGGTLSNFPIDHFHTKGVPLLPTFGVRLSPDRAHYSDTSNLVQMFHAMNDASRQAHSTASVFTSSHL